MIPRWLWVNQPLRVIAWRPLLITVQSNHTSGMSATPNAAVTSTVAKLFLTLRIRCPGATDRAVIVVIRTPCDG